MYDTHLLCVILDYSNYVSHVKHPKKSLGWQKLYCSDTADGKKVNNHNSFCETFNFLVCLAVNVCDR